MGGTQPLDSEQRRLDAMIRHLNEQGESAMTPSLQSEADAELLLVCTALVRLAVSQAEGINILLKHKMIEATAPIERVLYELWVEFRYLLEVGSKVDNARKLLINATMEIQEVLEDPSSNYPREMREAAARSLASYETEHPPLFKAVVKQRSTRHFHWSGLNRSKMEQAIAPGSAIYRGLSWEAHGILAPIRDVTISTAEDGSGCLEFKPLLDPQEQAERIAQTVGDMLHEIWNEYAREFGFRPTEL